MNNLTKYNFEQRCIQCCEYGSVQELITINIEAYGSRIDVLREVSKVVDTVKDQLRLPDHVSSPYDCTGQPFGSRFKRIFISTMGYDTVVLLIHSFSTDI
jgi:hypothetical protein